MDRLNSEGISRSDLALALSELKFVRSARVRNACMLCRTYGVNEAGLCRACMAMLEGEELRLAQRWVNGVAP
ncbi:MAG: hypothetical protein SFX74_03870 [Fimbriimonadaceae bacterium]|nr:hypothetical protein [Fimbriimonadaceae bacterium]